MSFEILKAGILDTVQDAGRPGYRKWGIGPGGVMDSYASRMANALVGNHADAALVEMHFPAPHILFHRDALVSITGAEMMPALQGYQVALWKPLIVKAGNILTFERRNKGARCYLAIRGGIAVAPWLGSRSTNLKINAGGFQGRALRKGDVIPVHDDPFPKAITGAFKVLPWSVNHTAVYKPGDEIFFTPGHEWNWLSETSRRDVLTQSLMIGSSSDRMASHVSHSALSCRKKQELLSSAVSAGTIQVLPGGNLLILLADHQTTGGYPRIGHVATAHLPRFAQLHANDVFRLKKISVEDSEKMLLSLGRDLRDIHAACRKKLKEYEAIH
jgi:antagonist of KipI